MAQGSPGQPEVAKGRALLKAIAESIADDWTRYEGKNGQRFPDDGFARLDSEKVASFGKLNSNRREIANAILELSGK